MSTPSSSGTNDPSVGKIKIVVHPLFGDWHVGAKKHRFSFEVLCSTQGELTVSTMDKDLQDKAEELPVRMKNRLTSDICWTSDKWGTIMYPFMISQPEFATLNRLVTYLDVLGHHGLTTPDFYTEFTQKTASDLAIKVKEMVILDTRTVCHAMIKDDSRFEVELVANKEAFKESHDQARSQGRLIKHIYGYE